MLRFFIYTFVFFMTGFIAIYALSNSDSLINIETANFVFQTNIPFFLIGFLCLVIFVSLVFFCLYWFARLPVRLSKSKQQYFYKKYVDEIFDIICDLDMENVHTQSMKKYDVKNVEKKISHPIVELVDYKIASYIQNNEKRAIALARIKNNLILGPLYYKEMILSKIHTEHYEDAREFLLEFMKRFNVRPAWFYKIAIFVFSSLGDVLRGKDIINKAKKAGQINNYAYEMSTLYLNKVKSLALEGRDIKEQVSCIVSSLEYDSSNNDILMYLYGHRAIIQGNKEVLKLLKKSWITSSSYELLDLLFYLEPCKDGGELKDTVSTLLKKNNSDHAKIAIAKFLAKTGEYAFALEVLEKVYEKTHNLDYQKVYSFLEIVHLSDSNSEKLEILKQQLL